MQKAQLQGGLRYLLLNPVWGSLWQWNSLYSTLPHIIWDPSLFCLEETNVGISIQQNPHSYWRSNKKVPSLPRVRTEVEQWLWWCSICNITFVKEQSSLTGSASTYCLSAWNIIGLNVTQKCAFVRAWCHLTSSPPQPEHFCGQVKRQNSGCCTVSFITRTAFSCCLKMWAETAEWIYTENSATFRGEGKHISASIGASKCSFFFLFCNDKVNAYFWCAYFLLQYLIINVSKCFMKCWPVSVIMKFTFKLKRHTVVWWGKSDEGGRGPWWCYGLSWGNGCYKSPYGFVAY